MANIVNSFNFNIQKQRVTRWRDVECHDQKQGLYLTIKAPGDCRRTTYPSLPGHDNGNHRLRCKPARTSMRRICVTRSLDTWKEKAPNEANSTELRIAECTCRPQHRAYQIKANITHSKSILACLGKPIKNHALKSKHVVPIDYRWYHR